MKSVQSYINEVPQWPDGTSSPDARMASMQSRIFGLACAGKFFEGMVVFMTGVASRCSLSSSDSARQMPGW